MLEDIVDNISVNNLRDIIIYLTCSQSELIGIGCSECPYYVSDKMLRCYIDDGLPALIK